MEAKISVILPTFNCNFIERSISSVINQTYKNWELIVIDNYSKNNVEGVVNIKNDKRIRYFKFNNHGVIAKSRNFGIKKAKFAWIAFIDSDDYWTKDKLYVVSKNIEKYNYDFFYHNMFIKTDNHSIFKKKLYKYNYILKKPIFDNLIINGNSIIQSSVVVKKNLIKRSGYISEKKKLVAWEDFDLWLNISRLTNKFYLIPKTMGYYYVPIRKNQKLTRFIRNIKEFKKIYKEEIKKIKKKYKIDNIWWINYSEALMHFKKENYDKAYFKIKNISTNSLKMNLNIKIFKITYHLKKLFNGKKN